MLVSACKWRMPRSVCSSGINSDTERLLKGLIQFKLRSGLSDISQTVLKVIVIVKGSNCLDASLTSANGAYRTGPNGIPS